MTTYPEFDYSYPEEERIEKPRRKKQLKVLIYVFDKDDKCIREHCRDMYDNDSKRWFQHMLHWAMTNGFSIEIENAKL